MSVELVNELLRERTGADQERRIIDLVREMDDAEVNRLLTDQTADRLLGAVDDHLFGPDLRTELVHHLVADRGPNLDLDARVAVLRALQSGHTAGKVEDDVVELFKQVHGNDLTHLKNKLDQSKDRHNLEGLVYRGIDSDELRKQLLAHIAAEATQLSGGDEPREAKVLSDIDDTVFCKLHDKRYPKGITYPGVIAFQEALDKGPDGEPMSMGDLTFVTARPKDVFGLVAGHSRESLNRAGVADLSMLQGNLFSLVTLDAMAGKKVDNITHYSELFPEYDLVFMGDSGQGDVKVGHQITEKFPEAVRAVFIHDVVESSSDERDEHAAQRIWYHDTYVGAACQAYELGLVSSAGLRHVVDEASEQFAAIAWDDDQQRQHMQGLFDRDRQRAAGLLGGGPVEAR